MTDSVGDAGVRSALQRSIAPQFRYAVTIITDDAADAVQSAGGWISDRVRAGWRVSALIAADCDASPLRILGVSTERFEPEADPAFLTPPPATLALRAPVLDLPDDLATLVSALLKCPETEIAIWGDGPLECSRRFEVVQHRLSPTARAFKTHAMRAAGLTPTLTPTEVFRSCAPWYRLDAGADLEPSPTTTLRN